MLITKTKLVQTSCAVRKSSAAKWLKKFMTKLAKATTTWIYTRFRQTNLKRMKLTSRWSCKRSLS